MASREPSGGMGECGTSFVPAAATNAIFAVTGKRLRKLVRSRSATKPCTVNRCGGSERAINKLHKTITPHAATQCLAKENAQVEVVVVLG